MFKHEWKKWFRKRLAAILCLTMIGTMLSGVISVRKGEAALLQLDNPGFESGLTGWTQISGSSSMVSSVTSVVYEGAKSLKIVDNVSTSGVMLESGKLNALEGITYTASTKFYQVSRTAGYAKLSIAFYGANQTLIEPVKEASATTGNNAWQDLSVSGIAPSGTLFVSVRIGTTSAYMSTAAYYDDLTLSASDRDMLNQDKQALAIGFAPGEDASAVKHALTLPATGLNGSVISWQSSNPSIISPSGAVSRPPQSEGDQTVTLTANMIYGMESDTRTFIVTVKSCWETLSNPGFETGNLSGWSQLSGTPANLAFDQSRTSSGAYSLKFNDSSNTSAVGAESEKLDAVEGISYSAAVQVYIESGNASIYLRFYSAAGGLISQFSAGSTTRNKWTPLAVTAVAPPGAEYVSVVLFSSSANVGVSYYDSVVLQRTGPTVTNVELPLTNPGFEADMTGWTIESGSMSSVSADSTRAYSGTRSLLINDASAADSFAVVGTAELAAESVTYTATAKVYQKNRENSRAYFYLYFYDEGRRVIQTQSAIGPSTNNNGSAWSDLSIEAQSPVGAKYVSVGISTTSTYKGMLWVDDIKLSVRTKAAAELPTDVQAVTADAASLSIGYIGGDHALSVTGNLNLPAIGLHQTVILWSADRPDLVGRDGTVIRARSDETVHLTAELIRGEQRTTKTFTVRVVSRLPEITTIGDQLFNSDFQEGLTGWKQVLGSSMAVGADEDGYEGKAIRISNNGVLGVVVQSSAVKAERTMEYTTTARIKVNSGAARVELRFYDEQDNFLLAKPLVQGETSSAWRSVGIRGEAPEHTRYLRVVIVAEAGGAADFLLDEIEVSGGDFVQNNRGFESGMLEWSALPGNGAIELDTSNVFKGNRSLKLTSTTGAAPLVTSVSRFAAAGESFAAFSKVLVESGKPVITLAFYDDAGQVLASHSRTIDTPQQEWTDLGVKAAAPAGAKSVSFTLTVDPNSQALFDEAYLTKEFTYLGVPIKLEYIQSSAYGKSPDGRDLAYSVVANEDRGSSFVGVDLDTSELVVQLPIAASSGAFTTLAGSDNNIYVGSYIDGRVYKFVPGASEMIDLGIAVPGQNTLFGLTDGRNGVFYGGTYDQAYVFKYTPGTGFTTFGPNGAGNRFDENEAYVRGMTIDTEENVLYVGIGSHAKLIRYELDTGASQSILPEAYADSTFVYHLKQTGGKLFATVTPNNQVLVLSVEKAVYGSVSASVDAVLENTFAVSDAIDGKVYYVTADQVLHVYDIALRSSSVVLSGGLPVVAGVAPMTLSVINMSNQTAYPGYSVVGFGSVYKGKTGTFVYNIQTNAMKSGAVDLPAANYGPRSLMLGPNGDIYSSNHLGGGTGIYHPLGGVNGMEYGLGQAENGVALDGKMYFGTYTHARIMAYDPSQPWNLHQGGSNPQEVFELNSEYRQDRPFGMAAGDGLLFVGTAPDYGLLGGAIAIYDPHSGNKPTVVTDVVYKQSVVTLAYKDGILYGGTSVWGGLGVDPEEDSAKFFAYDVASHTKLFEIVIAAGKRVITSVTVGSDGKIWGMCEGYVFVYDPATGTIVYNENLFPEINYAEKINPVLYGGQLIAGDDGYMYGNTTGKFFRIHPVTKQKEILRSSSSSFIEKDDLGNMYYSDSKGVWRYAYFDTADQAVTEAN
ncbi:immunoglobulin-like domain-containing protein [Paenibacillus contaminans]|uniref:Uncharacterized protein n=1 Tax=Paenibacillus contaminans TaxID=450362 RepID=A0A329MJG8_9BACL|nr:immunoglobulin-like domain-containing protein [Paenibacillus contaminans]RAV19708.1 hypothetical protein DQG23_19855 [Paenibacillus contaminans]